MGKILYLEPVGGIAGDMFLAAALDLGVELAELERMLQGLNLPGWHFVRTRAERHAIHGTHLDVASTPADHHHTPLSDIQRRIRQTQTFPEAVKARALAIFQVIGEAEAKIHDIPVATVEFHEVGAVDSIVDICGAACVLELLGNPEVFSAPPPLGSGTVKSAHGIIPVPAPATLEILRDVPVRFEGVGELTTPTGAAILKAVAHIGPPPQFVIQRVGYGLGTRDSKDRANVLRASLGERSQALHDVLCLEANLDDCSPQLLGEVVDRLMAAGALDAHVIPAVMKKGRPGHLLGVVVTADLRESLVELILRETTTLGVRYYPVERRVLDRRMETVTTRHGSVGVKLGLLGGRVVNAMPEFEDCRRVATLAGVSVKQVWTEAVAAAAGFV